MYYYREDSDNSEIKEMVPELIDWCRQQLASSGGSKAVIGISGGKDSTVVAALMAAAIGEDRVFGLILPDGDQNDLETAKEICRHLRIRCQVIDITAITTAFKSCLSAVLDSGMIDQVSEQTRLNLPPRVRMAMLYAVSQSIPGSRVINTSNLSEDWIGYVTLYGDSAGAFAPLGMLTSDEVIVVGRELGVPARYLLLPPADGLTGRSDEEVFGFSYAELNNYIRSGEPANQEIKIKIDRLHRLSRFKFLPLPMFRPPFAIRANDLANIYRQGDNQ
ncbi:MAG: NAD(+) synthase [Saccharofermentanales bacterium]|jgi:NAD+ synthase|nr:NAD(+) synthase [Bacillota bacterium]